MERLIEYQGMVVPESYINATDEERAAVCNGCGTTGWKGKLVPDAIWGLCVTPACQVHDWMYHLGQTEQDKDEADMVFMRNLIRLINEAGGWLASIRRYRATTYYNAVAEAGDAAFWDGKVV